VVLEDYKLKIKVIVLAFVFLIGCIHLCEVDNVFGGVCDISNSCEGIVIIIVIITGCDGHDRNSFYHYASGPKGIRIDLMINSLFYYIRHMTEQHVICHITPA
jgi:hypothetical protein